MFLSSSSAQNGRDQARGGGGSGQGNLSGQIVKNLIVSRPCIEEQKQIGAFFNQLNNTITVNERELNKLKELKKSYLKDMFV